MIAKHRIKIVLTENFDFIKIRECKLSLFLATLYNNSFE